MKTIRTIFASLLLVLLTVPAMAQRVVFPQCLYRHGTHQRQLHTIHLPAPDSTPIQGLYIQNGKKFMVK